VRVQGDTTGEEVSRAIDGFNAMENAPDLIIVARGGGSIEDLWGFNDEIVVRAAANSNIPLISAVGHETDWTLIDLAADVRAPTPTAAAELAVPVKAELNATVASFKARLQAALTRKFEKARSDLTAAERGLASPEMLLALPRRRLDEASSRLGVGLDLATRSKRGAYERTTSRLSHRGLSSMINRNHERLDGYERRARVAFTNRISATSAKLEQADRMLGSLSYKRVLDRGYAVVRDQNQNPVSSVAAIKSGESFYAELKDGKISAVAAGGAVSAEKPATKPKSKPKPQDENQGDLF